MCCSRGLAGRHVLELGAGEGERRLTEGERHDDEIRILTFFMRWLDENATSVLLCSFSDGLSVLLTEGTLKTQRYQEPCDLKGEDVVVKRPAKEIVLYLPLTYFIRVLTFNSCVAARTKAKQCNRWIFLANCWPCWRHPSGGGSPWMFLIPQNVHLPFAKDNPLLRCASNKLIGQIRKETREQNVKGRGNIEVDESLMGWNRIMIMTRKI